VAVVNCRLAEGGVAQQFYCWGTATTAPGAEATVYGVEGSIEIRVRYGQEGGGVVLFRPDLPPEGEWVSHAGNYHASFTPTVEDWLLACRGDKAPVMSGAEGLRDLAIVTAACASIEQGGEVAVR
jgi:predicted dehydrogenase